MAKRAAGDRERQAQKVFVTFGRGVHRYSAVNARHAPGRRR
ncbi:hypothetical protein ABIG06_000263 [Bradyrhizobium sp. USDA 326]